MAQEMVLIPKEEYESLMLEQDKKMDDVDGKVQKERIKPLQSNVNDSQIKDKAQADNLCVSDERQEPNFNSSTKGEGKKYVKQSMEQFLKLASKPKRMKKKSVVRRNPIKQRWIQYKM